MNVGLKRLGNWISPSGGDEQGSMR